MDSVPHKRCNKCGIEKPLTEFYPHRGGKFGRHGQCKRCRNAVIAARAKRPEIRTIRNAQSRNQQKQPHRRRYNREWLRQRRADPTHAEQMRFTRRAYYHRKKIDPTFHRMIRELGRTADHRRRARMHANGGSFTVQEWRALCTYYDHKCLCCGERKSLTIDHVVPISKGGNNYISNVQPLCETCNKSKGDKTIDYRTSHTQNTD